MKRQNRVVWTKGMLLSPQHFQVQEQYFEDLLQFRFAASLYSNYGVSELEIDRDALANGLFKVVRAKGVLQDGETFSMPGPDELPPSLDFSKQWKADQETLDIYLSLPERRLNSRNVTLSSQREVNNPANNPVDTRYLAETWMATDDNQGFDEKEVIVGRRAFRLLLGSESRKGYTSLRIARVSRNATGKAVISPAFVAPCLDLSSSEYLMGLLRRQVEVLVTKSGSLSGPRRQRGKLTADFQGPGETAKFWLLHTVNSYLPELRHIYNTRHGHPETAYVAMLRLAGALSTFSLEGGPGDLPDYDHDDLGLCFGKLDGRIIELLETVIPSKFRSIPLAPTGRSTWTATVDDDNLFKETQFYLAVNAKMGVSDIIQNVPKYLKLSAPDDIELLIQRSLAGVMLRHVEQPPHQIPTKLDYQYFHFNQTGTYWDRIVMLRRLAVYAPADIKEPNMEVVVVME